MYQHKNCNLLTILQVNITMKKAGGKMEHQGIKIEFIGQIGKIIHLHFLNLISKSKNAKFWEFVNSLSNVIVC